MKTLKAMKIEDLYYLPIEIELLQEELEYLRWLFNPEVMQHSRRIRELYADYHGQLEESVEKAEEELLQLRSLVVSIEDNDLRLLVLMRYRDRMTWRRVKFRAEQNGIYYSEDYIKKLVNKWVKEEGLDK